MGPVPKLTTRRADCVAGNLVRASAAAAGADIVGTDRLGLVYRFAVAYFLHRLHPGKETYRQGEVKMGRVLWIPTFLLHPNLAHVRPE